MNSQQLIPIQTLCTHYNIEITFFKGLYEHGLIDIVTVETAIFIYEDQIQQLEKMIRLHQDLQLNIEGIDTVINLLEKIDDLQSELQLVRNRLGLYEDSI
jgi:hypothetical protein